MLAYGQHPRPTGVFFSQQRITDVADAILQFERLEEQFDPVTIRSHALNFDTSVFIERMRAFVESELLSAKDCARPLRSELPRRPPGLGTFNKTQCTEECRSAACRFC